ncbi:hypothetical protein SMC26_33015 [Actinomadura fulvescens]|uniref:hypothetical protein n=1 Tax=Actinomadura fulvescens TaxID=46160 RepID=UPI0031D3F489
MRPAERWATSVRPPQPLGLPRGGLGGVGSGIYEQLSGDEALFTVSPDRSAAQARLQA